jgi:hypothetical protein
MPEGRRMTQAEIDKKLIDTHRLNGDDAAELEQDAGSIVARIGPDTRGKPLYVPTDQANALAAKLAKENPGNQYAVYKLARVYHAPEPSPIPWAESEARS